MTDVQNLFDQPGRNKLRTYDVFEKLQQIKELITQLVVCWTRIISKAIIR